MLLCDQNLSSNLYSKSKAFLLLISAEKDQIPVFEKKPLIWEEDMELYSKFLDRKVFITFNELVINVIYYSMLYIYIHGAHGETLRLNI